MTHEEIIAINLDEVECEDVEYDGKIIPKEKVREIGKFAQWILIEDQKNKHLSLNEQIELAKKINGRG